MFEIKEELLNAEYTPIAKIKVIGVGGGGNNTVHSMIEEGIEGVDFIVANTDAQVLNNSIAPTIIQLGKNSVKGLGAGADPQEGENAAIESEKEIEEILKGADMVIIAAGMGGGTGTGAAPIIAQIARKLGALTVGVVTTPFIFEGTKRNKNAKEGLENLKKHVDSLILVSNDKLLKQFGGISLKDSFMYADKILKQTVRTITDLIAVPALINLDFADVKTVMKDKGSALIGIGRATGEDRASKAAIHAISSPILEASIDGASNAIINISGGDITLEEASRVVEKIQESAGNELNIIFGVSIIEELDKEIQVSVIATGLNEKKTSNEEFSYETNQFKDDSNETLNKYDASLEDDDEEEMPSFLRS